MVFIEGKKFCISARKSITVPENGFCKCVLFVTFMIHAIDVHYI